MSEPCLRLHQVHKWVTDGSARTEILRGISVDIMPGEFVAIMGASGSGKTTLLNIMGLLDTPSAGHVQLLGRDTRRLSNDEQARLRARSIGFVFQTFNLIPYLTAQENIRLGMLYARTTGGERRTAELLESVHLKSRAQAFPSTLSGGERQRVAIARALANAPALVLADEPTGALDSKTGQEVLGLLKALHRSGTALVLVTHDDQVSRHAQRVLHMRDGRLL